MPDDNESVRIPNTVGFGYIGLALCGYCWKPNHIFVDSAKQHEYCRSCHTQHAFSYGDDTEVSIPSNADFPVLDVEVPICQVCEYPELPDSARWRLSEAYLSDGQTLVVVHDNCSRGLCHRCDRIYAYGGNRSYHLSSYAIPHNQLSSATIIEQENHCDPCAQQFWEENDPTDFFCCPCCESETNYIGSSWYRGERYCSFCIDNNVYTCGNCDELCWEGNDHDCEEDEDDSSSLIHSYSYKPSPFFFGEGKYHFGFELEVEARNSGLHEGALTVSNILGAHAYLKEDGSLDHGFEIVTHPHTLENYHSEFNWSVLDKLKSEGFRSWNTSSCGLHVHISRTAFGEGDPWDRNNRPMRSMLILKRQSHELRFMKLIYDNQRQVERISGRSSDRYASFEDKGKLVDKVKNGYQGNGRFSAINTENDSTIEVRVFKGSLRKERVLSAIEFVHASVEYTRNVKVTSKNHALSWLKFTGYVASNAELYPNLVIIMSESFAGDETPNETDN